MWGVCPLLEKAGLARIAPIPGLFYRCVGVMAGMIALALFWVRPNDIRSVDARSALCLALAGFLASLIGQFFFYNALKLGDVSRLAPIGGSYPFFAFLLGLLFFGESASPLKIAGVVLIVSGVWLLKIG